MGEVMFKDLIELVFLGKDNVIVNIGCRFLRLFFV